MWIGFKIAFFTTKNFLEKILDISLRKNLQKLRTEN